MLGYGLIRAAHPGMADAEIWERLCVIDTENESGSLYVGTVVNGVRVGEYLTINLDAPFSAARYLEAIDVAEQNGVEFLIIDSLSHAWSGEGGLLDVQSNIAKRSGNSYTAWREVTPQHNKLVDRVLQCPMHVAITLRTKTEYVIEDNGNGKKSPKKVGMAPVFRDGIEYEVTVFFELSQDHIASATKDRTGVFDGQFFTITPDTGSKIRAWLEDSDTTDQSKPVITTARQSKEPEASSTEDVPLAELVNRTMMKHCEGMNADQKSVVAAKLKQITGGTANYRNITDESILRKIYEAFKEDNEA